MDTKIRELIEKDERYVWHALSRYTPVEGGGTAPAPRLMVAEGSGAWVSDAEGNRYLDGMSGLWCVNVGYGREELARAAYEQLQTLPYYPLTMGHEPAVRLGEKLNEWLGGASDDYVFYYSNSGSEANEVAFKIARQYHQQNGEPGRHKFVSRYRAYHGNTFAALAATGQAQRKYRYEPLAGGFLHVAPPERYVEEVAEICRRMGTLLIIDEVICGFGRTGRRFGHQHHGVKPDIVTMAKGITSGYLPLSATAVRREVFEAFKGTEEYDHFRHVNTFGGNPAACALALRNLEIMEEENLPAQSAAMGERLRAQLADLEDHPNVGQIRNKGLLFGLELVEDKESRTPATAEKVGAVIAGCKERGLIVAKNGDTGAGFNNVVTLAPPLIVTDDDLEFISGTLKESLASL